MTTGTTEAKAPLGRWLTAILMFSLTAWVALGGWFGTTENSWIPRETILTWGVGICAVLAAAAIAYAVIGQKAFNQARTPQQDQPHPAAKSPKNK